MEGRTPEEVLRELREIEITEEDKYFKPHRYNEFSREPILFFKALNNRMLKWQVKAGEAFKRKERNTLHYYLPFTFLASPLGSQLVMTYKINLEMMKLTENTERKNLPFESIWPLVLHLFNHWVRNQASLMRLSYND